MTAEPMTPKQAAVAASLDAAGAGFRRALAAYDAGDDRLALLEQGHAAGHLAGALVRLAGHVFALEATVATLLRTRATPQEER